MLRSLDCHLNPRTVLVLANLFGDVDAASPEGGEAGGALGLGGRGGAGVDHAALALQRGGAGADEGETVRILQQHGDTRVGLAMVGRLGARR